MAGPWRPVVDVPEHELLPYVRCCSHNQHRPQSYWVWTWKADDASRRMRVPYRCGSWRCPYGCRQFAGHLLYARIVESFQAIDPDELVMIVLTLPGLDHVRGLRSDADLACVYRDVLDRKAAFWKRLRRYHEARGWAWIGSSYVTVLEQHRSGVPHVNLLVHSRDWAAALRRERPKHWLFDADLQLIAEASQWGWRCTAEPVRDGNVSKLAGYLVKLAGRTDAMHGELAKACQIPTKAPRHFRRLRSGKGFLVPRRRKEGWTGAIVRRKWTEHGDELVMPLVLSKNEEYMQRVRECCERETVLARGDENRRSAIVEQRKMLRSNGPIALDDWLARLAAVNELEACSDISSHVFYVERARPPPPD